ncbi:MAG: hypothetical protein HGB31_08785 [Erysipelotrichaceae bacterium]|jgi:hypothetical protein|nr:hypothetical protein [Erysipelotrichaceae bacterium]
MNRKPLKDEHFKVIGYVETDPHGNQTLKDEHFKILGYYDPKTDYTKDEHFKVVGHGNILTSLLKK